MRSHLLFICVISLMLLALAVAGHNPARTAPFILKPNIPLATTIEVADRKPAALVIEPVTADELIQMNQ